MAKSGILRALRRAVRAALAPASGRVRASGGPSGVALGRRVLLVGAAAFGAAPLVGCGATASNVGWSRRSRRTVMADAPVAIVGAGLAGLTAAWSLQRAGVGVAVYEARREVGGRVSTHRGLLAGGLYAELGGELIDSGHEAIRGLARDLGLALDDLREASRGLVTLYEVHGKAITEAALVEALRPIAPALARDAKLCGEIDVPHLASGRFAELDRTSVADWLAAARCPSPAREIIEVAFTTELGLDASELSCVPMLLMLRVPGADDTTQNASAFALYGDSDERFRIRGGNDRLVEALRLAAARIELEHVLTAVRRDADGRVRLTFAGKPEVVADHVVMTVPFSVLREVQLDATLALDDKKRRAIAELGYGTNAKHVVETIARPWRSAGRSGEVYTTRPLQCTWDGSRAIPALGGLITNFRGGKEGLALAGRTTASVIAEMEQVTPGIRDVAKPSGLAADWPTVPTARGSYSTYRVGQLTAFGGVEGLPAGNLHFAGEHTSIAYQGFMEGAVASGLRAADEILAARGASGPGPAR